MGYVTKKVIKMANKILQEPVEAQKSTKPKAKLIDRRRFLELSRKYAVIAPPAITLLIAGTNAKSHCTGKGGGPHGQPSCATNH